jgi:alpha-galactosidase
VISYKSGRAGRIAAIQDYSRCIRTYKPGRDGLLLSNTWGDRSRDSKISEEFLVKEIEAGRDLGVDVMEVDDGWQKGATKNSSVARSKGGVWSGFWKSDENFWTPHPKRLPGGLTPVTKAAGLHVGLWYAPDSADEFTNWKRDADHIIKLHRQHGVDYFKLDSITMKTAQAEMNVRRMLDRLTRESDGRIVTDLDVTAGVRPGYFGAVEAGAVFVENRYTDWGSYWPHWTLRNFWSLAQYVDPVRLRMEFLNNTRNAKRKTYRNNPLAPHTYPPSYLFASIMFGSPLAWFEVSNLPKDYAKDVSALVAVWKEHRSDIQEGHIVPIGNEPDGHQWTGFASVARDRTSAYVLVLREVNTTDTWKTRLPLVGNVDGAVHVLSGSGTASLSRGEMTVSLSEPRRYLFTRVEFASRQASVRARGKASR